MHKVYPKVKPQSLAFISILAGTKLSSVITVSEVLNNQNHRTIRIEQAIRGHRYNVRRDVRCIHHLWNNIPERRSTEEPQVHLEFVLRAININS